MFVIVPNPAHAGVVEASPPMVPLLSSEAKTIVAFGLNSSAHTQHTFGPLRYPLTLSPQQSQGQFLPQPVESRLGHSASPFPGGSVVYVEYVNMAAPIAKQLQQHTHPVLMFIP